MKIFCCLRFWFSFLVCFWLFLGSIQAQFVQIAGRNTATGNCWPYISDSIVSPAGSAGYPSSTNPRWIPLGGSNTVLCPSCPSSSRHTSTYDGERYQIQSTQSELTFRNVNIAAYKDVFLQFDYGNTEGNGSGYQSNGPGWDASDQVDFIANASPNAAPAVTGIFLDGGGNTPVSLANAVYNIDNSLNARTFGFTIRTRFNRVDEIVMLRNVRLLSARQTGNFATGRDFTASATTTCQGGTITLTADAAIAANGWSYQWQRNNVDLVGETNNTLVLANIQSAQAGNYRVIYLPTASSLGCTLPPAASESQVITVNGVSPVVTAADTTYCPNTGVLLTATTGNAYQWNLNGGPISGATQATYTATTAGSYSVTVTSASCTGTSPVRQVLASAAPLVVATATTLQPCLGSSSTLQASGANSFSWANLSGTTLGTGASLIATPDTSTSFVLTGIDANGCEAKDTIRLEVVPYLNAGLGANRTTCQGTAVTLKPAVRGLSYAWSNGATSDSISVLTAGSYFVSVTTGNGCVSKDTVDVFVTPYLNAGLGANQTTCQGTAVTLKPAVRGLNYSWSTGATTDSISVLTAGSYYVSVTTANGCVSKDTLEVQVTPYLNAGLGANQTTCQGTAITLKPAVRGLSYSWSTGATTDSISVLTAGSYYVSVTTANGCVSKDTVDVFVTPYLNAGLGANRTTCQGTAVTLKPTVRGLSYSWSTGATTDSISVLTAGSYYVSVTTANGCVSKDTVEVQVTPYLNAGLGANQTTCQGTAVTLKPAVRGLSYSWSTGATTDSISVLTAGSYYVSVTTANGCVSKDTVDVFVTPYLNAGLGANRTTCQGTAVTLKPTVRGLSYSWSNGATADSISVLTAGSYYVSVTTANGCVSKDTVEVQVTPYLNAGLGANRTTCQGTAVTLKPTVRGLSYSWSNGATADSISVLTAGSYYVSVTTANGCVSKDTVEVQVTPYLNAGLGANQITCQGTAVTLKPAVRGLSYSWSTGATTDSISVLTAGSYYVSVTTANGCVSKDTVEVQVTPYLNAGLGANQTTCQGTAVTLKPAVRGLSYSWSTGATTDSISVLTAGSYYVSVTTANGCVSKDTVEVQVTPYLNAGLGANQTTCQGTAVTLKPAVRGLSYSWSTGATTDSISVLTAGSYYVSVTTANGCVSKDTVDVITTQPIRQFLGPDRTICEGDTAFLFSATGQVIAPVGGGLPTSRAKITTSGTYAFLLLDNGVCVNLDTIRVVVLPRITEVLPTITETCDIETQILTAPNGYIYLWSNGESTQTIMPGAYGSYEVLLSNGTCSKRIATILQEGTCSWDIPNVITANGDGNNDVLRPTRSVFVDAKTTFYTRLGIEVGQSTDPEINWKGENLPAGVYYYYLSATLKNGNKVERKGWVELLK